MEYVRHCLETLPYLNFWRSTHRIVGNDPPFRQVGSTPPIPVYRHSSFKIEQDAELAQVKRLVEIGTNTFLEPSSQTQHETTHCR